MRITNIKRSSNIEATWDFTTNDETYSLGNGCISHNTSSLITNSTNGIEPALALVVDKGSKDATLPQVVPELRKLKNKYDLRPTHRSPLGYLKIMAVLQKYVDQGISVNTTYNPEFYPDGELPMSELLQHMLLCYKWGMKQLYYFNTNDGSGEIKVKMTKLDDIIDDGECEGCAV